MSTKLSQCQSCRGFVPRDASKCPHCSTVVASSTSGGATARSLATRLRIGALGGALGGGAIAFTLMACYGAPPPCPDGQKDCYKNNPTPSAMPSGTTATPSAVDGGK